MASKILGNPWKGLNFYKEGEIIYGRNSEIQSLSQYIFNNTQTVLYGRSGIGKSSILNAGIFPKARLAGMIPVSIRLNHEDDDEYLSQIRVAIENSGLVPKPIIPAVNGVNDEMLWEFIHRHEFHDDSDNKQTPLLVFDQFEEIFTLQRDENKKKDFFRQLGDLLNDVKPAYIVEYENQNRQRQTILQETKVVSSGAFKGLSLKLNKRRNNDNPLNVVQYIEYPEYHIVFAMREDFLSSLELYASSIPVMKDNRFGLLPLNEEQAADIIRLPREGLIDNDVTKLIIQQVTGRDDFELDGIPEIEVDAAVLSLFLSRLYVKKSVSENKITSELVNTYSGHIIHDFYVESIASNEQEHEILSEHTILLLEDQLLTREGRRNNVSRNDLIAQGVKEKELSILIYKRKLLRQFYHGNDIRIEFIHDILCPVVKERKEQRQLRIQQEIERKKQEEELKRIRLEEEEKRQSLLEEYKKEKSKEKERRKEKNRNKILQAQNALNIRGRHIWDNKTFSFSVDNTRSNTLQNSSDRFDVTSSADARLKSNTLQNSSDRFDIDFAKLNSNNEQRGDLFLEQLLDQFVNNDRLSLDFKEQQSKDGISRFDIHTCFCNGKRRIKHVFFYNTTKINENETTVDFFTKDGFHGISIDYDKSGREIRIKYMCNGFTSVGISSIEFTYNDEGLPICAKYFDAYNNPCKHCDGNYGVKIEYDEYGNEIKRWFINELGEITHIYNGICGVFSQYDSQDRLISQYFVSETGKRTYDIFGYHGVRYEYYTKENQTKVYHIDIAGDNINNPEGYCIEERFHNERNLVIEQKYYNDNGTIIDRRDGTFEYSRLVIGYDIYDRPNLLTLLNRNNEIVKIIKYKYHPNGLIAKQNFYGTKQSKEPVYNIENNDYISLSDNGVFAIKYKYTKHGFLKEISYWNYKDEPVQDNNGIRSIKCEFDDRGRLCKKEIFKSSANLAEEEYTFSYMEDGTCKITIRGYIIKNIKNTWKDILSKAVEKHTLHRVNSYRICNSEETIHCVLNSRFEIYENILNEDNDFIPGTPLIVQNIYNNEGEITEQRMIDRNTRIPICNSEGEYGWKITSLKSSNLGNSVRKVNSLNANYDIENNKFGYATEETTSFVRDGYNCLETIYFNKSGDPVLCNEKYHKCVECAILEGNDSYKTIEYFDCYDNPTNCADGYHKQNCEIVDQTDSEAKIVISFIDAEGKPAISKKFGYHKHIEFHSRSQGYINEQSFWDTNDNLITCEEGFAKIKVKRRTSYSTYFYYPFCDHEIIRFYDKNDEKTEISYNHLGKKYKAYKLIRSFNNECVFSIYDKKNKRVYIRNRFDWKYSYLIIIPILTFILLSANILYWPFRKIIIMPIKRMLYRNKKQDVYSVIIINELNETVEGFCPLKTFGIKPGTWILKWNDWHYSMDENVAESFEIEFNKHAKDKAILFYSPNEPNKSKRFQEIKYYGETLGARITDSEVDKKKIDEMMDLYKTNSL